MSKQCNIHMNPTNNAAPRKLVCVDAQCTPLHRTGDELMVGA